MARLAFLRTSSVSSPLNGSTVGSAGLVGSVVLVPSGDDDAPFGVRIVAGVGISADECPAPDYVLDDEATAEGKGCIVSRRVLSFLPQTPLNLPVVLRKSCLNVPCSQTQTCVNGVCRDARVDPEVCATDEGCGEDSLGPAGGAGLRAPPATADRCRVAGLTGNE